MVEIKTRKKVEGTIRTLDKTVPSQRIRKAAVLSRQKLGSEQETKEERPEVYAQGKISAGAERIVRIAVITANHAGRKAARVTAENIVSGKRQLQKRKMAAKAAGHPAMRMAAGHTVKIERKPAGKVKKHGARAFRSAKVLAAAARAFIAAAFAGGWLILLVVVICCLFGAAFYFFGDENAESYIPVSPEVEAYAEVIDKYCKAYDMPEYTELVKAVMMQESGGKGKDPMQSSECEYNTKYPKKPNGITDPEYSVYCGVRYLKKNMDMAQVASPVDMDRIKLALQGYNFGTGYISWALSKYGGYSYAGAAEFTKIQAEKMGTDSYGDKDYVAHVLRYYPYGNYTYDVMDNGNGVLGLPIKGMTRGNISSHFGPRSSPGGIGSTNHQGIDIAFPMGTKVLACESGTVVSAGWNGGLGKCVIIQHGANLQTVYGHMSKIHVKAGQMVVRGQVIGKVGSTGDSTGPHLHLGVKLNKKFVNPEKGYLSIPK